MNSPYLRYSLLSMTASVVAFSTLFVGCNRSADPSGDKGGAAKSEAVVDEVKPKRASLPRLVEQPGTVQAYEMTHLYARVPGYVRLQQETDGRIAYDIGRTVRGPRFDSAGKQTEGGEVLAEIVVPELAQDVAQKKALTRQAEAEVEQARKALASAEANIASMDAAVVEARALLELRDSESRRIAKLVKSGVLDAQAGDEIQNQLKAAGARVSLTEAAVSKAKADRDKASADVKAAEARIDVRKAEADRTETMLAYAKIRAPFDGIITARPVNTGDFVQPNGGKGEWLFTIARLDPVRVVITVPEVDVGRVQLDKAEVKLHVPALVGKELTGPYKLTRTSWALDPNTRTLRMEIDVPNKDGRLRPGMYVYAKISNPSPEAWTLPASAVVKQGDTMNCYQIDDQGKLTRRTVQIGRSDGVLTEILRIQKGDSASAWEEFTGEGVFAARASGLIDGQNVRKAKAEK
jgi:HlyD family secretion protein